EPLRLVERRGLAQDLLRNRELADVVQAAREPRELDLDLVDAEPARDPRGQLADALRVTSRVRVALVDRLREASRRLVARRVVGVRGELPQLDDAGPRRLVGTR